MLQSEAEAHVDRGHRQTDPRCPPPPRRCRVTAKDQRESEPREAEVLRDRQDGDTDPDPDALREHERKRSLADHRVHHRVQLLPAERQEVHREPRVEEVERDHRQHDEEQPGPVDVDEGLVVLVRTTTTRAATPAEERVARQRGRRALATVRTGVGSRAGNGPCRNRLGGRTTPPCGAHARVYPGRSRSVGATSAEMG